MPASGPAFENALFDSASLRVAEARAADAFGDDAVLMRRAGAAAWRTALEHWPQAQRLVVVCGPGNNGGDGYVLATHALEAGRDVVVVAPAGEPPRREPARRMHGAFVAAGGRVVAFEGGLPPADLLVDALFGIGLSHAPDTAAAALIDAIDAHGAPVLSLDVPSGVDADRGSAPGRAVRATRTVEFLASKPGLRTGAALDHTGACTLAALDATSLFDGLQPAAERVDAASLPRWLHPRPRDSHKGRNGRVLCIGGERGSGGAVLLAAQAALRAGAGLVDVFTRPAHVAPALTRVPEAMVTGGDDAVDALARIVAADVLAVGPGLGQGAWAEALMTHASAADRPRVLDADALNLLARGIGAVDSGCILTPHPGEAARLLGSSTAVVQRDRFAATLALVDRYRCTVVLKGGGTLVAAPGMRPFVVDAGNPGMAVGGMGDVLTGVIAALRAQGLDAPAAALCGALLHASAGDAAATIGGERGLLPTDLMPHLRRLANPAPPRP